MCTRLQSSYSFPTGESSNKGQNNPLTANNWAFIALIQIVKTCSAGTGGIWETLEHVETALVWKNGDDVWQHEEINMFFFRRSEIHFDYSLSSRKSPAWSGVAEVLQRCWALLTFALLSARTAHFSSFLYGHAGNLLHAALQTEPNAAKVAAAWFPIGYC